MLTTSNLSLSRKMRFATPMPRISASKRRNSGARSNTAPEEPAFDGVPSPLEFPFVVEHDSCGARLLLPGYTNGNQDSHLTCRAFLAIRK